MHHDERRVKLEPSRLGAEPTKPADLDPQQPRPLAGHACHQLNASAPSALSRSSLVDAAAAASTIARASSTPGVAPGSSVRRSSRFGRRLLTEETLPAITRDSVHYPALFRHRNSTGYAESRVMPSRRADASLG